MLREDILTAIAKIERYCGGLDKTGFLADEKTADAVVRNLEVIGEAARHLPESFRNNHPDVPWRQVIGLRNRVVHDYAGVDLEIVWEIVRHSLPNLRERLDTKNEG